MPVILFVCTANICRSPMASALFTDFITKKGEYDWKVESAGTWAPENERAAERASYVMGKRDIDLGAHRSRIVSHDILGSADLVLTMEKGHKEALQAEFPQFAERIFTLSEMIGEDFPIEDPMGRSLDQYERAARLLDQIFTDGFEEIKRLASK